ncbi:putative ATP-grasp target RiPP [Actinopolyspora alba]|uniref:Putative ATP-grasp target RiPP n=1 Tax=Actinopolyspora alba TaxID=673379 RepID=A0A1I2BDT7_9ACTN|nr:putative ATP-grasp-modified RiPP [Actinopolyspora alba]SFE54331.1 putative ATP-grasp target RiPP [Actinopolyspora alba]
MTTMFTDERTEAFAYDPVASHSAQFPLARPQETQPAGPAPRPWGLRNMVAVGDSASRELNGRYDHDRQLAVDDEGMPLHELHMGMTSTNMDGNEGPSEDWSAKDFAPDMPESN